MTKMIASRLHKTITDLRGIPQPLMGVKINDHWEDINSTKVLSNCYRYRGICARVSFEGGLNFPLALTARVT